MGGAKPSKEYPLHLSCYRHDRRQTPSSTLTVLRDRLVLVGGASTQTMGTEIHTLPRHEAQDHSHGALRHAGTKELFGPLLPSRLGDSKGYLLCNHGPVVFSSSSSMPASKNWKRAAA